MLLDETEADPTISADAPLDLPAGWPDYSDPNEWLRFHFERCRGWLDDALKSSRLRTHDLDHVWSALVSGECQLWPKMNSVALTQIQNYPTGKRVMCIWLAGGDVRELKATHVAIENFARAGGCEAILITGRRGWMKSLGGYHEDATSIVKELV